MELEKPTKILPETDGWDAEALEHPKIQRLHRMFFATGVFCAVVIAALAGLYFWPVTITYTSFDGYKYEYHVRRFDYWFKMNSTGHKLEIRFGMEKKWNPDGKLIWERDWSNDKWDGWEKEWYPTGQLSNEQEWKVGKKDGIDRYWHTNGQLWRETHWKNDIQQGDALVYDDKGNVVNEPKPAKILDLGDGIKMELMEIPAGEFMMGSEDVKPIHKVKLTKPFYMGKFEVTQEQYEKIMGTNPSDFKGAKNPVEQVSWKDADEFCRKLSVKTGMTVTLPTEAQWEYACQAGSMTKFYYGDDDNELGDFAWYKANSGYPRYQTHPVGQKLPNAFGLYDMSGNVWERCFDFYGSYPDGEVTDPMSFSSGGSPVLRGGGWDDDSISCRSSSIGRFNPDHHADGFGFRVVAVKSP